MTSFALIAFVLAAHAEPSLMKVASAAPAEWPAGLREAMEPEAWSIAGDGLAMTFRFRKELTGKATEKQLKNGISARELIEGQLVGVLVLTKPWTDYRKQEIAAGTYTLRLGFQPDIGDHKGTAPYTEFLLLTPMADDEKPEDLDAESLRKRSVKAAGGDHPAVLLLTPHTGAGEPKLEAKKAGVRLFTLARSVKLPEAATIRLGIVVEGVSAAR